MNRSVLPALAALSLCGAIAQTPPPTQPPQIQPTNSSPNNKQSPTKTQPPAANYVLVGNYYYERGNYEQAYVAFKAAHELENMHSEALLGLIRSETRLRLYDAAIAHGKQLILQDPHNLSGFIALSQAYSYYFTNSADRQKVSDMPIQALNILAEAENILNSQTTKISPEELNILKSKIFNERGNIYRIKGDNASAIQSLQKAAEANPENSLILFNLGDMYERINDHKKALEYLQKAVLLDPADSYSRAYYAKVLANSGQTQAAMIEATQAARLSPENAYAVGQYGLLLYASKDIVNARKHLTKAIALEPLKFPEFYYTLGRLDLDVNDLKSARAHFTKAVALTSKQPEYAYYLGLSYEKSNLAAPKDIAKAKSNYELALRLDPQYTLPAQGLERLNR